jgi:hypothetical protein
MSRSARAERQIFHARTIMTVKGVDAQEPLEYVPRTFDRP